jgi:hypothetical protein
MNGGKGIAIKSNRIYAILSTRRKAVVNMSKLKAVVGYGKVPGMVRRAKMISE